MSSPPSSSVVTSAVPTTSSTCGGAVLYDTPTTDAACAMPYSEENVEHMKNCCKDADIVSYYDDCGLYCLAIDQSVDDLSQCLFDDGVDWGASVFCNANGTTEATGSGAAIVPSATASVIVGGDDDEDDNNDSNDDNNNEDDNNDDSNNDNGDDEGSDNTPEDAATGIRASLSTVLVGTLFITAFTGVLSL